MSAPKIIAHRRVQRRNQVRDVPRQHEEVDVAGKNHQPDSGFPDRISNCSPSEPRASLIRSGMFCTINKLFRQQSRVEASLTGLTGYANQQVLPPPKQEVCRQNLIVSTRTKRCRIRIQRFFIGASLEVRIKMLSIIAELFLQERGRRHGEALAMGSTDLVLRRHRRPLQPRSTGAMPSSVLNDAISCCGGGVDSAGHGEYGCGYGGGGVGSVSD